MLVLARKMVLLMVLVLVWVVLQVHLRRTGQPLRSMALPGLAVLLCLRAGSKQTVMVYL